MEKLAIEPALSSPSVIFDPDSGLLEIGGESYPENSFEFYAPIISWLKQYLAEKDGPVTLSINLSYLNTSSTKCMIDLLDELEAAFRAGRTVAVEWSYDDENERELDTIDEFREDFSMPFSAVPRKEPA